MNIYQSYLYIKLFICTKRDITIAAMTKQQKRRETDTVSAVFYIHVHVPKRVQPAAMLAQRLIYCLILRAASTKKCLVKISASEQ